MTWVDLLLVVVFAIGASAVNKMEDNYICPNYCTVEHTHNYVEKEKETKQCQSLGKEVKKD